MCAILLAPMLFMGMIPAARAEDVQDPIKENAVTGPGAYTYLPHSSRSPLAYEEPLGYGNMFPVGENIICGNMLEHVDYVKGPGGSWALA